MKRSPWGLKVVIVVIVVGVLFHNCVGDRANKIMVKAENLQKYAKYNKAIPLYDEVLQKDMTNARAHYNKGLCLYRLNNISDAVTSLYQAIKYKNDYFDAYLVLGFIQMQEGWYTKALDSLQHARTIQPKSREALMNIANIYVTLERYENAIYTYNEVISAYPKWFLAYYQLGVVYYLNGMVEKAKNMFEETIKRNPEYTDVYSNLAVIYEEEGDVQTALHYLKKRIDTASLNDSGLDAAKERYKDLLREMQ